MIPISLSEKFCCQNLITSIKVINMTRNSSKSNKLRNINTISLVSVSLVSVEWIEECETTCEFVLVQSKEAAADCASM